MSTTTTGEIAHVDRLEDMPPRKDLRLLIATIPLAIIALVAGYFYFIQISRGIGLITGLNRPTFWGLYLVNCIFFVGVSAGGVVIASLVHAFGLRDLKPIARIAELMAICCTVIAAGSLFVNLCWPTRMYYILRYPHPTSPIFWDMVNITTYFLISLAYAYLGTRADLVRVMHENPRFAGLYRLLALGYTDISPEARRRDQRVLRILAGCVLVAEVAVQTVSAWLFGLQKAQPGWFGGYLAPLFVIFAVVSGLSVLTVTLVVTRRLLWIRIDEAVIRRLGKIVFYLIPLLGYFLFVELVTVIYGAQPAQMDVYKAMMFGPYAEMFWGHLIFGLLFPFLLLGLILFRIRQRTIWIVGVIVHFAFGIVAEWLHFPVPYPELWQGFPGWVVYAVVVMLWLGLLSGCAHAFFGEDLRIGVATFFVAAGVLAGRWNIVVPSLMGHTYLPFEVSAYLPTLKEFVVFAGVYALGALLYIACVTLLPLVEPVEE